MNFNKYFDNYIKSWAIISKTSHNLNYLLNYSNSFYYYHILSNQVDFDLSFFYLLSPQELHFFFVELSLINLSPIHRDIISLRYIQNLNWDIISFKVNFSRRSCFYFRKKVILNLHHFYNYFCTNFAPIFTKLPLQ